MGFLSLRTVEQSTKCSDITIVLSYYGYVLGVAMMALDTKNGSYDLMALRQCQLLSDMWDLTVVRYLIGPTYWDPKKGG